VGTGGLRTTEAAAKKHKKFEQSSEDKNYQEILKEKRTK
jgi:hypothetical protein